LKLDDANTFHLQGMSLDSIPGLDSLDVVFKFHELALSVAPIVCHVQLIDLCVSLLEGKYFKCRYVMVI
jgi:hypothetical protein